MTRSGEEQAAAGTHPAASPASKTIATASSPDNYCDALYLGWVMRIRRTNVTVYTRGGIFVANTPSVAAAKRFIRHERKFVLKETEVCRQAPHPDDSPSLGLLEHETRAGSGQRPLPAVPGRARNRKRIGAAMLHEHPRQPGRLQVGDTYGVNGWEHPRPRRELPPPSHAWAYLILAWAGFVLTVLALTFAGRV